MRHVVIIIAFFLFSSASASARDAHVRIPRNERTNAQARAAASRANLTDTARVTATDVNAPGSGWGKNAPKDTAPCVCDYGSAMSDEDIAFCRSL